MRDGQLEGAMAFIWVGRKVVWESVSVSLVGGWRVWRRSSQGLPFEGGREVLMGRGRHWRSRKCGVQIRVSPSHRRLTETGRRNLGRCGWLAGDRSHQFPKSPFQRDPNRPLFSRWCRRCPCATRFRHCRISRRLTPLGCSRGRGCARPVLGWRKCEDRLHGGVLLPKESRGG